MTRSPRPSCCCLLFALLGVAALTPAASGQGSVSDSAIVATDPKVHQIVAADTAFGFAVLGQLNKAAPDGNVFFSPFGISDALTLALDGAGGSTRYDMAVVLGVGTMAPEQINRANVLLLSSFARVDPKTQVSVANALWAGKDSRFSPSFTDHGRRFYAARVQSLDFASPSAAGIINAWVKDSTRGKIDSLFSPSDLVGMSAVLTNAVYFQGRWQTPFLKSATKSGLFTLETGATKTLPMMAQTETFPYLDTPEFQAAALPYGNARLSLYVFLPKTGHDLDGFVGSLNAGTWEGWVAAMNASRVDLTLPRFKVDYTATLNPALTALGMGSAFTPTADFTPMGLRGSFFSAVVHKAVLEVDEEGTVAAAATAGGLSGGFGPPPVVAVMHVDHPFFCAIRDNVTGTVLFAGLIRDPD